MPPSGNVSVIGADLLRANEIPAITVYGPCLPAAWETAVLAVWEHGCAMPTEYDADIDPESRVASMMMVIGDPLAEPRIHRAFPDGLEGLALYTAEVVDGGVRLGWQQGPDTGTTWLVSRKLAGQWVEVSDLLREPSFLDARGTAGDEYLVVTVGTNGQLSAGVSVVAEADEGD